jgi:uncharacterized membrane protein YeaQ/YmgE (transglycosylase-associated protein family)
MSILGWIVVGLVAGFLARMVVDDEGSGCVYTMVVGVLGALIGGTLFSWATDANNPVDGVNLGSIAVAFVGGCLLLLVLQAVSRRRT